VKQITAIIPARGGSVGIPRKNIALVGEYPLIAYSIAACQLCKNIDRIIVSTDDEEIARIAKSFGAEIPFMRPAPLATAESTDVGFLRHFFENIPVKEAALIRPTTPFRSPYFMDEVVTKYFEVKEQISGLRTVNEVNENPYKVYKLEEGMCRGFFPTYKGVKNYTNLPRQTFPKAYSGNGHIDIVKRETVLTTNTTFGDAILAEVCENIIDIDSLFDLKLARHQLEMDNTLLNFLKGAKNDEENDEES